MVSVCVVVFVAICRPTVQRLGCIASGRRGGRFDVGGDVSKDQSPDQGAERTDQLPVGGEPAPSGGVRRRGTCLGRDQRSVGPVWLGRDAEGDLGVTGIAKAAKSSRPIASGCSAPTFQGLPTNPKAISAWEEPYHAGARGDCLSDNAAVRSEPPAALLSVFCRRMHTLGLHETRADRARHRAGMQQGTYLREH